MTEKIKPTVVQGKNGNLYTRAKKSKPTRHEEIKVQRPIVRILTQLEELTKKLTFFHVPNQLLRRPDLRRLFKGLGVRSGVPDLVIPIENGRVIFIELKYGKGSLSKDQCSYLDRLKELGHIVYVLAAEDATDAQRQIFKILEQHGVVVDRIVF